MIICCAPHWPALVIALIAISFEGFADLLDPWPIKIVLDHVIGSKHLPAWLASFSQATFGANKSAILGLAVTTVIVVAVVGAVAVCMPLCTRFNFV